MTNPNRENVLTIQRQNLPPTWLESKTVTPLTWSTLQQTLAATPCKWLERDAAETQPQYKQLIPYALVTTPDHRLACYQRKGSEKRLHQHYSLGIGGHINPIDHANTTTATIQTALTRELHEELDQINTDTFTTTFLGIINEEKTTVGNVHMGLVFLIQLNQNQPLPKPLEELTNFQWAYPNQLTLHQFELWSQLALSLYSGYNNNIADRTEPD